MCCSQRQTYWLDPCVCWDDNAFNTQNVVVISERNLNFQLKRQPFWIFISFHFIFLLLTLLSIKSFRWIEFYRWISFFLLFLLSVGILYAFTIANLICGAYNRSHFMIFFVLILWSLWFVEKHTHTIRMRIATAPTTFTTKKIEKCSSNYFNSILNHILKKKLLGLQITIKE